MVEFVSVYRQYVVAFILSVFFLFRPFFVRFCPFPSVSVLFFSFFSCKISFLPFLSVLVRFFLFLSFFGSLPEKKGEYMTRKKGQDV